MEYNIENLIAVFEEHVMQWETSILEYNTIHPEMPRDLRAFSLCQALLTIVTEIKTLQDKHEANQPQIPSDMRRQESQNPQGSL